MRRVEVSSVAGFPAQGVKRIDIDGHAPIALFHLADGFFATEDTCTHGDASLADGFVENGAIICPFHAGSFDIRTGEPVSPPCFRALRTYSVVVEDGVVFLELA